MYKHTTSTNICGELEFLLEIPIRSVSRVIYLQNTYLLRTCKVPHFNVPIRPGPKELVLICLQAEDPIKKQGIAVNIVP